MVGGFHGMLLLSASDGKTPCERRFGNPFNGPVIRFGAMVELHPISAEYLSRLHQSAPKILPGIFLGYVLYAGGIWKRRHYGRRHWRIGADGRVWTPRPKAQCKGSVNAKEMWNFHIPSRRSNSQNFWRRSGSEKIHLNPGPPRPRRRTRKSLRRVRRVFFNPTTRLNMVWW